MLPLHHASKLRIAFCTWLPELDKEEFKLIDVQERLSLKKNS